MCRSVDFPAPEGRDKRDRLAGPNRKRCTIQDDELGFALPVAPLDRFQLQRGRFVHASLITKRLDRIEPRGPPGWIDGREK